MRDIGRNIRDLRIGAGMTQEELAEKLFVTRQTVSNYENGKSRPDIDMLLKIADLFDADINVVIYGMTPHRRDKYRRILFLTGTVIVFGILLWWLYGVTMEYRSQTYYSFWFILVADIGVPTLGMFTGWWLMEILSLFVAYKQEKRRYIHWVRVILLAVLVILFAVHLFDVAYYAISDISWSNHGAGEWSFGIPYIPVLSDISRFVRLFTYRYPAVYVILGILLHLFGLPWKKQR